VHGFASAAESYGSRLIANPARSRILRENRATAATSTAPPLALPAFWIDRFEVTNRQFKEFAALEPSETGRVLPTVC